MAKADKEKEEAVKYYEQAAQLFREDGKPDNAAETLVKAAKLIEDKDPEKACVLAEEACSVFEAEDREIFAPNTFKYAVNLILKQDNLEKALDLYGRLARINMHLNQTMDLSKTYLSMIIIHIKRNDSVSAERVYQDMMVQGPTSNEGRVASELLQAWEKGTQEEMKAVLAKQTFTFLDQQIMKLSKTLTIKAEEAESII